MVLPSLQIRIYDNYQLVYQGDFARPVELGRQSQGDQGLYGKKLDGGRWRLVIAGHDENTVSRRHALLEPLAEGRVRLTNLSTKIPVHLPDGQELDPDATAEVAMPAVLTLGKKTVRVQTAEAEPEVPLHRLAEATALPGQFTAPPGGFQTQGLHSLYNTGIEPEAIIFWLQGMMAVLQSAVNSSDFFQKAAQAVVEIVGLDSGQVLLLDEAGDWDIRASKTAAQVVLEPDWQPSRQVLLRVRGEKRTFWQAGGGQSAMDASSLVGVKSVVAAPILNPQGDVIGALYGDRRQAGRPNAPGQISKLEAMLVEVLASGVATGLARMEQEKKALALGVRFEQFFTPELAQELAAHPDMLQGRDSDVTILFCDIRRFSAISEGLGPARTVEWISDVMGTLSESVHAHNGVLVDYIGDELMAMWGAPQEQPDHARLACLAALDMLARLPELNTRLKPIMKELIGSGIDINTDIGIGINTGLARVGNTGTARKFKYGPLGNTVNLASRVQGATKYLKARLLVTGATRAQLVENFCTRRLGHFRVVNIKEPVELFELLTPDHPHSAEIREGYEAALDDFKQHEFRRAARSLVNLVTEHINDGPSLVLFSRVVACMVEEPVDFDPVWTLPGK